MGVSGAGKTTIARRLLEEEGSELRLSVSVTTRPMRPGERDGRDYFFVDRARFDQFVEEDSFFEWAEVFGHCYGTPKAQIREELKRGEDFLFDIDWQGTQQLYQRAQGDVVRVFLLRGGRPIGSLDVVNQRAPVSARRLRETIASTLAPGLLAGRASGPAVQWRRVLDGLTDTFVPGRETRAGAAARPSS